MANGLAFSSRMARVARDGLDGPAVDGVPAVVYPIDGSETGSADDEDVDSTIDVSGTTYAVGASARHRAEARDEEPLEIFDDGILSTEPYARPALDAIVEAALSNGMGSRLCYTVPGTVIDADRPTDRHRDAVTEAVHSLGYDATPVSTGYAVVADQLADDTFTGLGIDIGRDLTSVALVYYGVPVLAFSLAAGRDWIVDHAAGTTGHDASQVAARLDEFTLEPDTSGNIERALARAYDELCTSLVEALRTESAAADIERGIGVPVALGGSGAIDGSEYLFGGRFDAADLPFSIRGVRAADDPAESAVRGALAAAQEDVDEYTDVTWSAHASDEQNAGADESRLTDFVDSDRSAGETSDGPSVDVDSPADDDIANDAIEQLFDRLGTRDDEIADLQSSVDALQSDLAAVRSDLDTVDETAATVATLDAATDRLDDLESTVATVDETVSTLAAADRVAEIEADLSTLADDVAAATERLEAVPDERDSALESLETDVSTHLDDLRSTVTDEIEAEADRLEDAGEEREAAIDRLEEASEEREAAIDRLEEASEEREATIDRLEEVDEERESAIDRLEEAIDTVDAELAELDESLSPRLAEQESDVDALQSAVESIEPTVESLESAVDELDAETSSLGETVDPLVSSVADLESDVTDLHTAVEAIETELEAVDDRTQAVETDLADVKSSVSSTESVVDTLESAVETTESELGTVTERIDELESTIESTTATVDGLADSVDEAATDRESTAASVRSLRDEFDGIEATVSGLEETVTSLDRADPDDTVDAEQLADVRTEVSALADELSTLRSTCDDRLDDHDAALASLETDLDSVATGDSDASADGSPEDELADRVATIADRVETIEAAIDEPIDDRPLERIAELDQRVHELSEAVADTDEERETDTAADGRSEPRSRAGLTTVVSGGASAGVVSGAALAATGALEVGLAAVALGVVGLGGVLVVR